MASPTETQDLESNPGFILSKCFASCSSLCGVQAQRYRESGAQQENKAAYEAGIRDVIAQHVQGLGERREVLDGHFDDAVQVLEGIGDKLIGDPNAEATVDLEKDCTPGLFEFMHQYLGR